MYPYASRSSIALAAFLVLAGAGAGATDGVIELSHARALAGDPTPPGDPPGYPIVINQPGSYRLTSDLVVPAGLNGIELDADGVQIDLNGFTVRGPEGCFPGGCSPATSTSGIIHGFGSGGFNATILNGSVSGFGGSCIRLRDGGRVERVRVSICGEHGIHLRSLFGDPGMAFENFVQNTGQSGIVMDAGGPYRENVVRRSGLSFTSPSIVGGTATGGNFCEDGRCSKRGIRRYYLGKTPVTGNQALTACAQGYHMASRFEIADPSALEYDTVLGTTTTESGTGPPGLTTVGWARVGSTTEAFGSHCAGWTSTSGSGSTIQLDSLWGLAGDPSHNTLWRLGNRSCDSPTPVWCIED